MWPGFFASYAAEYWEARLAWFRIQAASCDREAIIEIVAGSSIFCEMTA